MTKAQMVDLYRINFLDYGVLKKQAETLKGA